MKILKIIAVLFLLITALAIIGQILPRPKTPAAGTMVTLASGMQINAYQKGRGQTVVLTHGLPGSAHDWDELVDALTMRNFHVVWYDRIGYGHSSRRMKNSPHTMQVNGQELDQLIEAMELENPALVGWSFGGGTVIASKAARHKETPFIVLLGAVGPTMSVENKPVNPPGTEIIMRMPILGSPITKFMAKSKFNDHVPDRWLNGVRPTLLMKGAIGTMDAEIEQLDPAGLDPSSILTPALIIHGRIDKRVVHRVGVDLAASLPKGSLQTMENAGHMLPMAYPEQIADMIRTFADTHAKMDTVNND